MREKDIYKKNAPGPVSTIPTSSEHRGKIFSSGFRATIPVAISVAGYGTALGVAAATAGVTLIQLVFMNATVFAGTAQFVMIRQWSDVALFWPMVVAVLIINLRYVLMTATLEPLFRARPFLQKALFIHLSADENWAVTMGAMRKGLESPWFLFGGGVCLFLFWMAGTIAGHQASLLIRNPKDLGLDFIVFAVFISLLPGLIKGKSDILPIAAAGFVAYLANKLLPGLWYVIIGSITGALIAVLLGKGKEQAASSQDRGRQ